MTKTVKRKPTTSQAADGESRGTVGQVERANGPRWSKKFPAEVGYYWYAYDERAAAFMIEISGGGIPGGAAVPFVIYGAEGCDEQPHLSETGITRRRFEKLWGKRGEFWGPLERPA